MPIVAHNLLPTFKRLKASGSLILPANFAKQQDIREIHIGLLNMMPDAALEATERQFYRLIGCSNQIAQFYIHPFTLDSIPRGDKAQKHIHQYYENFNEIKIKGLDALIISGANVTHSNLQDEPFWTQLIEVIDWAALSTSSIQTKKAQAIFLTLAANSVLNEKRMPEYWEIKKRWLAGDARKIVEQRTKDMNRRMGIVYNSTLKAIHYANIK